MPANRRAVLLFVLLVTVALMGPLAAPYEPSRIFRNFLHAPPMPPRVSHALGVYPLILEDRLEKRFVEDRSRTVPLPWLDGTPDPVFLLGSDASGRDVLSRLLAGARVSLGVGLVSVLGAMLLGALAGTVAGLRGGWLDDLIMRLADFVLVLPALYVVLVLRAALPLVLPPSAIFLLITGILILVGWPFVARAVRGIVARERQREYVAAARTLGAGPARLLIRHLLPASAGQMAVQATLLLPAFVLAEATLSYLGLGFPDTVPTWGTMLAEAGDVNAIARFPWTLAPAGAIFAVTLVTNAMLQPRGERRRRWRVGMEA